MATRAELNAALDLVLQDARQFNKVQKTYNDAQIALSNAQIAYSNADTALQDAKAYSAVLLSNAYTILAELVAQQAPAA